MFETPAGVSTSSRVHTCNLMPDWEADILGTPSTNHAQLVLQARRECGNAHPQQMFDPYPKLSETIGLVFAREIREEGEIELDSRDIIVGGRHCAYLVTWRGVDQRVPNGGMFSLGLVVLRADRNTEFRPFNADEDDVPLDDVSTYIEGLLFTNY